MTLNLTLEMSTKDLSLHVPLNADAQKRLRLAAALFDMQLLTQSQAAEMAGLPLVDFYNSLGRFGISTFQYAWEDAFAEAESVAEYEMQSAKIQG